MSRALIVTALWCAMVGGTIAVVHLPQCDDVSVVAYVTAQLTNRDEGRSEYVLLGFSPDIDSASMHRVTELVGLGIEYDQALQRFGGFAYFMRTSAIVAIEAIKEGDRLYYKRECEARVVSRYTFLDPTRIPDQVSVLEAGPTKRILSSRDRVRQLEQVDLLQGAVRYSIRVALMPESQTYNVRYVGGDERR